MFSNSPIKAKLLGYFYPKYRVQYIMNEKMKVLFNHPVVQKELEQGVEHASAYSFLLTRQGIKHLEMSDLDKWNDFRISVAENDVLFCSGLLKGNLNEDKMMNALAKLTDEQLSEFAEIMTRGGLRKINNEGDPATHVDHFRHGIDVILSSMNQEDKDKFQKGLTFAGTISDQEACWTVLKILTEAKKLPDQERAKVLKYLAGI